MSKMQIRFILTLIVIAAVSILSACDYDFALSPKQGLPLDNAFVGVWRTQSGVHIEVSKKNGNEYSIVYFDDTGKRLSSYTAYPVRIGSQLLVQVQRVGATDKPYQVFSYNIKGGQLTLKIVKDRAKTQAELKKVIIANKPNLFYEVDEFTKTDSIISFSAKGLNNEKILTNLYLGKFSEIPFGRNDMNFSILYNAYLNSYAQQCDAYLPRDKVEMTEQQCATERVTRNGFGVEISRTCIESVSVGTGLYADPEMYQAKLNLKRFKTANEIRMLFDLFKNPENVLGQTIDMARSAIDARSDMNNLVRMNSCSSSGLKRFQENLKLFALNKQPITLYQ